MEHLKQSIREVPDFPRPGIQFYDISTLFREPAAFAEVVDRLARRYLGMNIDAVLGIEARGFVLGSALAYRLNTGIILARKKGKLPGPTISESYSLEYGNDAIEINADAVAPGDVIIVVDDLLATGGTASAAVKLVKKCGGLVPECAFLVELPDLHGREKISDSLVYSILQYAGD
ncbi:adenine phosphoribosyltransferase [Patescibacteria group bacterium]|nr:adenine phosphoribosyltransferase [Patescibacteria group bacterium]